MKSMQPAVVKDYPLSDDDSIVLLSFMLQINVQPLIKSNNSYSRK